MTGFGTGISQRSGVSVTVEIRTVNHRFLDVHIRLGREYAFLESEIQQVVRGTMARGRVDVSVTVQSSAPPELLIDSALAKAYADAARKLREELSMTDTLDLRTLLTLPGVVQNKDLLSPGESIENDVKEVTLESLRASIQSVVQMRGREGEALKADMLGHLASISEKAARACSLVPASVEEYGARLKERLEQLLPPNVLDPQRLAQEVAILADRSDISEEFARLDSHIAQFNALLSDGTEVGKKLDFLLQEMQREVNTMLSKSGNLEIKRLGIAIRADIEKLREQAQNVE